MSQRARHRFSIYDAMDEKGAFDNNVANSYARNNETGEALYAGPVEFPKMFYHPEGAREVLNPGELVRDAYGDVKCLGRITQIICKTASNAQEAEALMDAGWHSHPAQAMVAAGEKAPPSGPEQKITALEKQIQELKNRIATEHAVKESAPKILDKEPGKKPSSSASAASIL